MSIEENKATFRRWFEETWNKGNMDVTDELTSPDFTLHAAGPMAPGFEGFKQSVDQWLTGFPGGRMTIDDLFAEEDRVIARWTASGTHSGELFGIPPTGKQVSFMGITIYRLADDKIAEAWGEVDTFSMMQQLGVIPTPGQ